MTGDELVEGLDHVVRREQPAVRGHDFEELRGEPADAGLGEHRGQRARLLVGGKDRAADQPGEIGALVEQSLETIEIGLDGLDGAASSARSNSAVA